MRYINTQTNQYPLYASDIRSMTSVLFGEEPPENVLNELNLKLVTEITPPTLKENEFLAEGVPLNKAGKWKQNWIVEKIKIEEVTAGQAQVALFNTGLLDKVEQSIANHPYPMVRIWWRAANVWKRDNPYIEALAMELGLTDQQVDDLFIAASKVET